MVTQAPKRTAVLAAIAFTLSCVGLMIFVWTQFAGTVPFAPQGYRIQAVLPETGQLVAGADVLNSFDPSTQRALQQFLSGSFEALSGRGQDLNNAIGNLDPAVSQLSAVVGV